MGRAKKKREWRSKSNKPNKKFKRSNKRKKQAMFTDKDFIDGPISVLESKRNIVSQVKNHGSKAPYRPKIAKQLNAYIENDYDPSHEAWDIENIGSFLMMLKHRRPSETKAATEFGVRFLNHYMGDPDEHGNYVLVVKEKDGSAPRLSFMSHYDTVHDEGGEQKIKVDDGLFAVLDDEDSAVFGSMYGGAGHNSGYKRNCLGADCTSGIWLMLNMIHKQVPGTYVIHADEEVGCKGAKKIVADHDGFKTNKYTSWIKHTRAAISFDRKGYTSIVTHQRGIMTASEEFSKSLSSVIGFIGGVYRALSSDPNGSSTDSNMYRGVISECTNISVGYFAQHTENENQWLPFLEAMRDSLVDPETEWSKIKCVRHPYIHNNKPTTTTTKTPANTTTQGVAKRPDITPAVVKNKPSKPSLQAVSGIIDIIGKNTMMTAVLLSRDFGYTSATLAAEIEKVRQRIREDTTS